jgi:hypothetical protein
MKYTQPDSEMSQPLTTTPMIDAVAGNTILPASQDDTAVGLETLHRSKLIRYSFLAMLCCLILAVSGCATSFTGDGIPPGRSAVIGLVVHADNPQLPVANALVNVTTTVIGRGLSVTRGTTSYPVYSDDAGKFQITGIPTDKIDSNVTVTVDPNDKTLLPQRITFRLANGRPTALILALPPAAFPLNKIATIKLIEQSSTNTPVPTAQFKAQVLDASGVDLGIIPTLIFDGSLAAIATDGTITVTANPDDQIPVVGSPLGVVTGTIDTHTSSASPMSSVDPQLPASTMSNNPAPSGPHSQ